MTKASCGNCDRKWTGLAECHCSACHRQFSAVGPFDAHRVGGVCNDPAELKRKDGNPVLVARQRVDGDVWVSWSATNYWAEDEAS